MNEYESVNKEKNVSRKGSMEKESNNRKQSYERVCESKLLTCGHTIDISEFKKMINNCPICKK